jgi:hypothetical protein
MVSAIDALLRDTAAADAMGVAARARIVSRYTWDAQLALLESALAEPAPEAGVAA